MSGGEQVAGVLRAHGVRFLFTLCGGHISPILVEAKRLGVRVVDVRHEATAVFAADAVARLTGVPGAAAVTAGPGVTNTITALQNAQMAESPVVVLGGATATLLEGRGALQDIDQVSLVRPLVKEAIRVRRVRDLAPAVDRAFRLAREGVPGPVFVECPVDLLYDRELVRGWYAGKGGRGVSGKLLELYLRWHVRRLFAGAGRGAPDAATGEGGVPEVLP
ncbi:MAG: thiamine pyrophosphate-binding protein, partial [Thermoanaerobaculia bacterium]